jgi:thioredoxin-related protein
MEDTDSEGARLARRFRIEGTPTLVILNSSGREVGRILGGGEALDLIDELKRIIESARPGRYSL